MNRQRNPCRTNVIRSVCFDAKRATERVFTQYTYNFLDCASSERQRCTTHTHTHTHDPMRSYVYAVRTLAAHIRAYVSASDHHNIYSKTPSAVHGYMYIWSHSTTIAHAECNGKSKTEHLSDCGAMKICGSLGTRTYSVHEYTNAENEDDRCVVDADCRMHHVRTRVIGTHMCKRLGYRFVDDNLSSSQLVFVCLWRIAGSQNLFMYTRTHTGNKPLNWEFLNECLKSIIINLHVYGAMLR